MLNQTTGFVITVAHKVLGNSFFDIFGFSNINNRAKLIKHLIDPWIGGQVSNQAFE
jgi:hypothetical protein